MSLIPNDPFPEYEQYDALGLAELVTKNEVSPIQLVDAAIARVNAYNPKINAVVYSMEQRAKFEAKSSVVTGPFSGVPFLLKDLMAEDEGEVSSYACKATANWRADYTCELVKRYRNSGVIIVGRTNTPECGIYNFTEPELYGATRNPWDTQLTPGGSSGGSGAAVASGMVPMAHGSDGGGSIRIPSSYCGLFGLKPSRGRNPCGPHIGESWGGLSAEHVLTRSVRDSAAMLDVSSGVESGAPYQIVPPQQPYLEVIKSPPKPLRIAFTQAPLFGEELDKECLDALEHSAKLAESLGHHVEEARPEFYKSALIRAYIVNFGVGVASDIQVLSERAGRDKPHANDFESVTWIMKVLSDHISASEYQHNRTVIQKLGFNMASFFNQYDILLTPTTAKMPAPIGTYQLNLIERLQTALVNRLPLKVLLEMALEEIPKGPMSATPNTMLFNLTGQPAMSTPLWWSESGLPVGTQWVGRFGDEATLLQLATQLEQAQPWFNQRPDLVKSP